MTGEPLDLLTSDEVAAMFRVDARTITRWCREGRIPAGACLRLPGPRGRLRFYRAAIMELVKEGEVKG